MSYAKLRHQIALGLWRAIWSPGRWFFNYFTHLEIQGEENLRGLKGPLIVAANHFHTLDAFIIGATLPKYSKLTPIRYGVWHKYYWHFLNFPFLWILGSFEVHRGKDLKYALKKPLQLLREGRVIGMFPEGSRHRSGPLKKGRRGTPYMAIQTNTAILPVYIDGNYQMTYGELLLRKRKIRITIGKPFFVTDKKTDEQTLNKNADMVMEKIRKLKP